VTKKKGFMTLAPGESGWSLSCPAWRIFRGTWSGNYKAS